MPFLENVFSSAKERTDFFISVAVITFFGVGILYYIQPDLNRENFSVANKVTPEQVTTLEKEDIPPSVISKNIKKQEKQWVDNLDRHQIENTSLAAGLSPGGEVVTDTLIYNEQRPTTENNSSGKQSVRQETTETLKDTLSAIIKKKPALMQKGVDNLKPDSILENINNTPTAPVVEKIIGDCAIFIGAFKSERNAKVLLEELKAEERFTPFSNYEKGYQVVGIRTTCDKSASNKLLEEIKRKYSKDAWFAPIEE